MVCPLDWGLGHASRMIPVINELRAQGATVVLAADGAPLELLRLEFPQLEWLRFPAYTVHYGQNTWQMAWKISQQIPGIIRGIKRENQLLKQLVKQYRIDAVISDNRFGLWNENAYTVYVTHQLMIKTPLWARWCAEPFLHRLHQQFIQRYNTCWVPDFEGTPNLSGDLSHRYPLLANTHFAGILSRFTELDDTVAPAAKLPHFDVAAILSGPEPQRSLLEKMLLKQFTATSQKCLIVAGKPASLPGLEAIGNSTFRVSHLNTFEMRHLIQTAGALICRAGYSSIMDLVALNKRAVLIPTPGQTEQEYLANYYHRQKMFYCVPQQKFNLQQALLFLPQFNAPLPPARNQLLKTVVIDLMKKMKEKK